MKVNSFQEMLREYDIPALDPDDEADRNEMLSRYKHSVILEGGFMEVDNLNKWIKINLNKDAILSLFYGKTDYDYGFWEYFFDGEEDALKVAKVIPNIYTYYPKSFRPNHVCKSNGSNNEIEYDSEDKDAILFDGPG